MAGAAGVPRDWLRGSPFGDYFLPGLFLFAIVGGTWAAAAALVFMGHRLGRDAAFAAGVLGLAWIGAQVAFIGYVSWLQPAVAVASLAVLALARRLGAPASPSVPP